MRTTVLPAFVLLATALTARSTPLCAQDPGIASTAGDPVRKVELLEPGAEPRIPLRYEFREGMNEAMTLDLVMTMKMSMMGTAQPMPKLPLTRFVIDVEGNELNDQGEIKYEFRFRKVDTIDDGTAAATMVEAMHSSLQIMVGANGTAMIDDRGRTKDVQFAFPEGANPGVREQFLQIKNQMDQMTVPLPEEPIGIGATWKATLTIVSNGITVENVTTYKLLERTGNLANLEFAIVNSAEPQVLDLPDLPPGATAKLTDFDSTGIGTLRFDRTKLVPKLDMSVNMNASMLMNMGEQDVSTVTDLDTIVKVYPGEVTAESTSPSK